MITRIPIRVECYSGGRADEQPRVLCFGDERLEVEELIDRWYQGQTDPAAGHAEYFKLRVARGRVLIVMRDLSCNAWFLVAQFDR